MVHKNRSIGIGKWLKVLSSGASQGSHFTAHFALPMDFVVVLIRLLNLR